MSYHTRDGYGAGWDVAGTDEYNTDGAFNRRVYRANKKLASKVRRQVFGDTKANRARYDHDSGECVVTLYGDGEPQKVAKALKGLQSLPGRVTVDPTYLTRQEARGKLKWDLERLRRDEREGRTETTRYGTVPYMVELAEAIEKEERWRAPRISFREVA